MLDPDLAEEIKNKSLELGLFAMNVPETFGGTGLNTLDWILAEEQFGHTTDILVRRAFGNVYDILFQGTPEQIERWLLPSVRGERVFSVASPNPKQVPMQRQFGPSPERNRTVGRLTGKNTSFRTGLSPIFSSSRR